MKKIYFWQASYFPFTGRIWPTGHLLPTPGLDRLLVKYLYEKKFKSRFDPRLYIFFFIIIYVMGFFDTSISVLLKSQRFNKKKKSVVGRVSNQRIGHVFSVIGI